MSDSAPTRPPRSAPVSLAGAGSRAGTGEAELDPERCPLCGARNECGRAAGRDACWCFDARIPAAALERIAEPARGRSCICPSCAEAALRREAREKPAR